MTIENTAGLKAPFPWFGGKSRVAADVWARFGDVPNYVEPFFGSGAVLLGRPVDHFDGYSAPIETINDADCFVANFWRALKHDPDGVAAFADNPVNEADLHANHLWLVEHRASLAERLTWDRDYYDSEIAGWWVWGQSTWIGHGWCGGTGPWTREVAESAIELGSRNLAEIRKQCPHLGSAGGGVNRKCPHLGSAGCGVNRNHGGLSDYMRLLAARLRNVRVCCGDWSRILGTSPTTKLGMTGVLLDPPYADTAKRDENIYATDCLRVAHDVRDWAVEHGDDPLLRIALCGYEGEHIMPDSWECFAWKANGGYANQGNGDGDGDGKENACRERIWFSPHCLRSTNSQRELFT